MKVFRTLIILSVLFCVISCTPWGEGVNNNGNGNNDEFGSAARLAIASEDVNTIAPYSYSSASNVKALSDESYLSYTTSDSAIFRPLVLESDNGTKVVFKNTSITEIGDGYYIAFITNLLTIKSEPRIEYKKTDEIGSDGKPIVVASEVFVDIERDYWNNTAIIDSHTGKVYLTTNPTTGEGVQLSNWVDSFETADYLYIPGLSSDAITGDEIALYLIRKDGLENGKLTAITNTAVFEVMSVLNVSDNFILLEQRTDSGPSVLNLIDLRNELPPTPITQGAYDEDNHYVPTFTYNYAFMLNGDYVYSFGLDQWNLGKLGAIKYKVVNGKLAIDDIEFFEFPSSSSGYLHRISVDDNDINRSTGIFAQRYGEGGNTDVTDTIFCVTIDSSGIDVRSLSLSGTDRNVAYFQEYDGKLYWISEVGGGVESYIKTYDFATGKHGSYRIPGKGAASYEFNITDDGSVIYWQYLGLADVGTFRWNPEKEDYPTMLMLNDTDVHSIVSIDSL